MRSSVDVPTLAVSPGLNSSINSLYLDFKMSPSSLIYSGIIEVGYMSDPLDPSSFVLVKSITPISTEMTAYRVYFNDVQNTSIGNHIAFRHVNSNGYYFYIDDVVIDSLPNCLPPHRSE